MDMKSMGAGLRAPPYQGDLEPGSVYEVVVPFFSAAGRAYHIGNRLELIEPTGQKPWGVIAEGGINWMVKCPHFAPPAKQAIWSCFQLMIDAGWLRRIR